MSASVILTPNFEREAKKLVKKYRSLRQELLELAEELAADPRKGIQIQEGVYKIRLAVKSKGKGKSGGMRVITYVVAAATEAAGQLDVYLLSIYDKSKQENVSNALIAQIISEILDEVQFLPTDTVVHIDQEEE